MAQPVEQEVVDPVCGMTISPADAVGEVEHAATPTTSATTAASNGSRRTRRSSSAPARRRTPRAGDDPDAEYTCPMHPEVRQNGPGSCPICGMALEPVHVSLEEQPNEELVDMTRRFGGRSR